MLLIKIVFLVIFIRLVSLIIKKVVAINKGLKYKQQFIQIYGVNEGTLKNKAVTVKYAKIYNDINCVYTISLPYWLYSRKDNCRDLRYSISNQLIWEPSRCFLDNYIIVCKNPEHMLDIVRDLYNNGYKLELKGKYKELISSKKMVYSISDFRGFMGKDIYDLYFNKKLEKNGKEKKLYHHYNIR